MQGCPTGQDSLMQLQLSRICGNPVGPPPHQMQVGVRHTGDFNAIRVFEAVFMLKLW